MSGHVSVLFRQSLEALPLEEGRLFIDGTLGGGGHSEGILKASKGRLIAIDKDIDAIERCKVRLALYEDRVTFVHDDFKNITSILENLGGQKADGAILDLGVSSFQLDEAERGFSYAKEAPLDMRMDRSNPFSAYQVVNEYTHPELARVIYEYGEESFGGRIASAILKNRPIETTTQLAEIVKNAIPAARRRSGGHPAKKTFQAIRIEVNGELDTLRDTVNAFIEALAPGGRLAIITFHSLEDRIVKKTFQTAERPCTCPPDFPQCVCGKVSKGRAVTRKPILPDEAEIEENPRSRSAKLRIFERQ